MSSAASMTCGTNSPTVMLSRVSTAVSIVGSLSVELSVVEG